MNAAGVGPHRLRGAGFCGYHRGSGNRASKRQRVVKEPEILKRPCERRLLRPVWVATLGFEIKAEVEAERKQTTDQI